MWDLEQTRSIRTDVMCICFSNTSRRRRRRRLLASFAITEKRDDTFSRAIVRSFSLLGLIK